MRLIRIVWWIWRIRLARWSVRVSLCLAKAGERLMNKG